MKKLLLIVLLFVSVVANAQKGISYQAVILDPAKIEIPGQDISGQPFVNGNVSVKFAIFSGTTSQFEEVQQTKTDAYGLVNLTIGSVSSTTFNALTWDANQKSLQVFVSFNNGASYTKVSDQKLTYTPYALFAETSGKLGSTLGITGGGTGAITAVGARANLGLGNVDNTADASKPISTATQAALDLKANAADVNSALALKATVAALQAHMAITADTTMLATKAALTDLTNYAPKASPTFTGTVSGIDKSMVGLGAVNNTSDASKPISTATQTALNLKAPIASPTFTGAVSGITKSMVGLGSVDNTSDASKPISTATQTALNLKAPIASPTFTGTITSGSDFSGNGRIKILSNNNEYNDAVGNQLYVNSYVKTYTGPAGNIPIYSTAYINGNLLFNSRNSVTVDDATTLHLLPPMNYNMVASRLWALYAEGNIKSLGSIEATGYKIPNGTSTQYLMADGSVSSAAGSSSVNVGTSATGVLPIANGGTGSSTKNFVDLTTSQTIAGSKIYSSDLTINGVKVGRGLGNNDQNVAVGAGALASGTGTRNTAVGYGAMLQYSGTSFDNNTSVGYYNMLGLTTGGANTSMGGETMFAVGSGSNNTAIGNHTLMGATSSGNTVLGANSGNTITTGSLNTMIGFLADVSTNSLYNASALGYGAIATANNSIQLGNTSVANVKTSGTITAGAITYPKIVGNNGQVLTTNGSNTASWVSPTSVTVGTISSTSNANGATITSGGVLNLTPADATNGGIVTNGAQTFAGDKTIVGNLITQPSFTTGVLDVNANDPTSAVNAPDVVGRQTFTSGISGYLTSLKLKLYSTGTYTLKVYQGGNIMNQNSPGGTLLYTTSFSSVDNVMSTIPITNVQVTSGTIYWFEISGASFSAALNWGRTNVGTTVSFPSYSAGLTYSWIFQTYVSQSVGGNISTTGSLTGANAATSTISGYAANMNAQTGTSYTLLASDNGKIITLNNASAITLTVPALFTGFNCMIVQLGAGEVTLTPPSGTTISNRSSYTKTAGTNAIVSLIGLSGTSFISAGDMR